MTFTRELEGVMASSQRDRSVLRIDRVPLAMRAAGSGESRNLQW